VGNDGNLWGTTIASGPKGAGAIFKITPAGVLTTMHTFSNSDGIEPESTLLLASDGNYYGTTALGSFGATLYRETPAKVFTKLYTFPSTHPLDEISPQASLIQATDGNLYGTTEYGGDNNLGTIFEITLDGTYTTLYSFNGTDGAEPVTALTQAPDGNFYGTTEGGGANGDGTVFEFGGPNLPMTTASMPPTALGAAWYKAPVMVSLSAHDPAGDPNVGSSFYSIDGGSTSTYAAPFTVSGDKIHKISYWSADTSSNNELAKSQFIRIDGTPPTTTQKLDGYKMDGAWVGGVTATLYPADATSGVKATYYAPSSTNIIPYTGPFKYGSAGVHDWHYWSVDNAGNVQYPVHVTATVVQPDIASLSQTSVKAGDHPLTLTLTGDYFISGATVTWNGVAVSATYVSANQITVIVPGHDLTTTGMYNIQVVNPKTYGKTNIETFTVN
jgi:uncharacterized repeat protein (TIGR03803 family)